MTGVVVLTRNRRDRVLATLDRLTGLPERPKLVVVDDASHDGTAEAVAARHPHDPLRRHQRPPHTLRTGQKTRRLQRFPEADEGTRTPDPLLTMEVLYRLSYVGAGVSLVGWSGGSRIRTCVG
jgi:GT2 family glycosyltransferase